MFKIGDQIRVKPNSEFPGRPFDGQVGQVFNVVLHKHNDFAEFYQGGVVAVDFDGHRTKGRWGIFAFSEVEKV